MALWLGAAIGIFLVAFCLSFFIASPPVSRPRPLRIDFGPYPQEPALPSYADHLPGTAVTRKARQLDNQRRLAEAEVAPLSDRELQFQNPPKRRSQLVYRDDRLEPLGFIDASGEYHSYERPPRSS